MNCEALVADPAGNRTLFVLSPVADRKGLAAAALGDPKLGIEQVGFVRPGDHRDGGAPRLEMMGGEFCGNAARSFGLFVARERGLSGAGGLEIAISGAGKALAVEYDLDAGTASVEIPPPLSRRELVFRDRILAVYEFEGISHVIAPDLSPEAGRFEEIRRVFEAENEGRGLPLPDALGVMFWDSRRMTPAVYVYGTASLVFESSCGSGSAAMGLFLSGAPECPETLTIVQPGGSIEVRVSRSPPGITIGGPVGLGEKIRFQW